MYDYRNDVIKLMQKTQGTKQSLDQSIVALDILLKVYRDQANQKDNKEKHLDIDRLSVQNRILNETDNAQDTEDSSNEDEKEEN